ncbi:UDP-N-acetylmuramate dehydrogenase [Natronospirillum operosum]|uniref:UDP-N-acetylenolpyruvoylglucosamine reductase n=1 Tax=Natronospirillum operosum TaxID=2759953 RepID=A0A4Z0WK45_9GAMM|nr:UDP-N-acetylmuramate dehydrogenase [Natronospirillum operosum]TGG95585.1 UDP-N-acetylmuramate dehydrogenase [Natronospirillum operosum]
MILHDFNLGRLQTMACASVAQHAAPVRSLADLEQALAWASEHDQPVRILGQGSNVLAAEQVDGLTLINELSGLQALAWDEDSVTVAVGSGINWHWWVRFSSAQGWYGLENLALIPGTVGAAPVQNIGAYGVEVESFIEHLEAVSLHSGEMRQFARAECAFSYRDSVFKHAEAGRWFITQVVFRLPRRFRPVLTYGPLQRLVQPTPRQLIEQVCSVRLEKLPQPRAVPNAGSFFTNPMVTSSHAAALQERHPDLPMFRSADGRTKLAAGWLIDQAGWKGWRDPDSGVGTWHQQALVIINPQRRPRSDVLAVAGRIQDDIEQRFGVRLEREPRLFG